ncbi:hypothetical protein ACQ7B2_32030, partial [Escherichia coli]
SQRINIFRQVLTGRHVGTESEIPARDSQKMQVVGVCLEFLDQRVEAFPARPNFFSASVSLRFSNRTLISSTARGVRAISSV